MCQRRPGPVGGGQGPAWRCHNGSKRGGTFLAPRDAFEDKGQRRPQKQLARRLEFAKAFGGGYCQLQMPLKPGHSSCCEPTDGGCRGH